MKKALLIIPFLPLLISATSTLSNTEDIYLSDKVPSYVSVGYSTAKYNCDMDGNKLSLLINDIETEFEKGFFLHAYSTIMYDKLYDLNVNSFSTYVGINKSARGNGNTSFKVYIFANQEKIYESDTFNSSNPSDFVTYSFNFKVNSITIVVDDLSGNGNDHAALCDTKINVGGAK